MTRRKRAALAPLTRHDHLSAIPILIGKSGQEGTWIDNWNVLERSKIGEVWVAGNEIGNVTSDGTLKKYIVVGILVDDRDRYVRRKNSRFRSNQFGKPFLFVGSERQVVVSKHALKFVECRLRRHEFHVAKEHLHQTLPRFSAKPNA